MLDMLKAGVHFGHTNSKWHPNMEPYIYTSKQNVHIIDLETTLKQLEKAVKAVQELTAAGKTVLFVGTKQQAASIIEKYAKECDMPYVTTRWLGGLLTNYKVVSGVPKKLTKLKKDRESGELKKYTKKEQLEFDREIERLESLVGGIESLNKVPDALFVVDVKYEKTAVREALQMNVPIIALCDTNVDPSTVEYPIPANDDAVKSIELVVSFISDAAQQGSSKQVTTK